MDYPIFHSLTEICDSLSPSTVQDVLINSKPQTSSALPLGGYFFFPFETHKYYEIAIQLSGLSIIEIESQYYILKENQILIVDSNLEHRLGIRAGQSEKSIMLWVATTNETIRPGISTYKNGRRHKDWALDIRAPGAYLIKEIISELELDQNSLEPISKYLSAFLMMLIRKLSFIGNIYGSDKKAVIISKVKNYIESHLTETITLDELGEIASVSPNYLCSLFKQVEGGTIVSFIQDSRVRMSIKYLLDTKKTIAEIAEFLGFYDQFHFSKTFKKFMGMSPANYRSTYRTSNDN